VLLALFTLRELLGTVTAWLSTRRMFAWAVDGWAVVVDTFAWLGAVGEAIGWLVSQIGTVVGLPLAWLAFASIIYFGTMPRSSRPGPTSVRTASERWERLPAWLKVVGTTIGSGILDRWRPVALAARLIWRSGPIAIGTYLLGFALLTTATDWLRVGVYRLMGPHDTGWWYGATDVIALVMSAIVGVLQVALVAAAFDHALRSDRARELVDEAGDAVSSAAAPAAAPHPR
jgi:hypothetical protein